jgi:hypothetical protein
MPWRNATAFFLIKLKNYIKEMIEMLKRTKANVNYGGIKKL